MFQRAPTDGGRIDPHPAALEQIGDPKHIRLHGRQANVEKSALQISAVHLTDEGSRRGAVEQLMGPGWMPLTPVPYPPLHNGGRIGLIPVLNDRTLHGRRSRVAETAEVIGVKRFRRAPGGRVPGITALRWAGIAALRQNVVSGQVHQAEQPLKISCKGFMAAGHHQISQGVRKGIQPVTAGRK